MGARVAADRPGTRARVACGRGSCRSRRTRRVRSRGPGVVARWWRSTRRRASRTRGRPIPAAGPRTSTSSTPSTASPPTTVRCSRCGMSRGSTPSSSRVPPGDPRRGHGRGSPASSTDSGRSSPMPDDAVFEADLGNRLADAVRARLAAVRRGRGGPRGRVRRASGRCAPGRRSDRRDPRGTRARAARARGDRRGDRRQPAARPAARCPARRARDRAPARGCSSPMRTGRTRCSSTGAGRRSTRAGHPTARSLVASMLLPDDANALVFVHADGDEYGRAGQAESYRWSRDSRFVAVDGVEPLGLSGAVRRDGRVGAGDGAGGLADARRDGLDRRRPARRGDRSPWAGPAGHRAVDPGPGRRRARGPGR